MTCIKCTRKQCRFVNFLIFANIVPFIPGCVQRGVLAKLYIVILELN